MTNERKFKLVLLALVFVLGLLVQSTSSASEELPEAGFYISTYGTEWTRDWDRRSSAISQARAHGKENLRKQAQQECVKKGYPIYRITIGPICSDSTCGSSPHIGLCYRGDCYARYTCENG